MINQHYKTRYNKFIQSIKCKGVRNFCGYIETHHIIPRCLKGKDTKDNLIKLTLREHFLAHWLLWKAYPDYLPLASAFLQMNNKNPKTTKEFQGRITSRTYENLKTNVYDLLKTHTVGWVYVKDTNGETIKLSKDEYLAQDSLKFHTSGKVYVFDILDQVWVYITTELYQNNKDRYKSRMSLDGFPRPGGPGGGNPEATIDVNFAKYQFIDLETKEIIKLTKFEARQKNAKYGYKRLKHVQKKTVKCVDSSGKFYSVPLNEYNPQKHQFYLVGKINVFDTQDNIQKIISLSEYYLNKDRYNTSTKGKVLAKDLTGKNILVSKEDFEKGDYVGQTKGLTTVKDLESGQFVQIPKDVYLNNKHRYVGPNQGQVNVIDKLSGERKQIPKTEFDFDRYCGLGNKKLLFLCRSKLTNKEKYINIYEWHLVKDQYEIIDNIKFTKILDLIK